MYTQQVLDLDPVKYAKLTSMLVRPAKSFNLLRIEQNYWYTKLMSWSVMFI